MLGTSLEFGFAYACRSPDPLSRFPIQFAIGFIATLALCGVVWIGVLISNKMKKD